MNYTWAGFGRWHGVSGDPGGVLEPWEALQMLFPLSSQELRMLSLVRLLPALSQTPAPQSFSPLCQHYQNTMASWIHVHPLYTKLPKLHFCKIGLIDLTLLRSADDQALSPSFRMKVWPEQRFEWSRRHEAVENPRTVTQRAGILSPDGGFTFWSVCACSCLTRQGHATHTQSSQVSITKQLGQFLFVSFQFLMCSAENKLLINDLQAKRTSVPLCYPHQGRRRPGFGKLGKGPSRGDRKQMWILCHVTPKYNYFILNLNETSRANWLSMSA